MKKEKPMSHCQKIRMARTIRDLKAIRRGEPVPKRKYVHRGIMPIVQSIGQVEISRHEIRFDSRPMAAARTTVRLMVGETGGWIVRVRERDKGIAVGSVLGTFVTKTEAKPAKTTWHKDLFAAGLEDMARKNQG